MHSLLLVATIAVVTVTLVPIFPQTNLRNQISLVLILLESNQYVGRKSFRAKASMPLHVVFDLFSSFQQNAKDENVTNIIYTTCGKCGSL
jgi:hypothetical protein